MLKKSKSQNTVMYVWGDNMFSAENKNILRYTGAVLYAATFMMAFVTCIFIITGYGRRYADYCRFMACWLLWCALVMRGCVSEYRYTAVSSSVVGAVLFFLLKYTFEIFRLKGRFAVSLKYIAKNKVPLQ